MKVAENRSYEIGLKVILVDMTTSEDFTSVNKLAKYHRQEDDLVLTVTRGVRGGKTKWVLTWLAVPDHDVGEVDSGLLTSAAAIRLLKLAPPRDKVARKALRLIESDYNRRNTAK